MFSCELFTKSLTDTVHTSTIPLRIGTREVHEFKSASCRLYRWHHRLSTSDLFTFDGHDFSGSDFRDVAAAQSLKRTGLRCDDPSAICQLSHRQWSETPRVTNCNDAIFNKQDQRVSTAPSRQGAGQPIFPRWSPSRSQHQCHHLSVR